MSANKTEYDEGPQSSNYLFDLRRLSIQATNNTIGFLVIYTCLLVQFPIMASNKMCSKDPADDWSFIQEELKEFQAAVEEIEAVSKRKGEENLKAKRSQYLHV